MIDEDVILNRAVHAANYNQREYLKELKEQKEIGNDQECKKYIENIEGNQNKIEDDPNMDAQDIVVNVNNTRKNWSGLHSRAKATGAPQATVDV